MNLSQLKFSTSNKNKQEEISKVSNIPLTHSIDLPEIESNDYLLVSAHKAKDIYLHTKEEGIITEDSILIIDGEVCTDIKFKFDEFVQNIEKYNGKSVVFVTTMSVFVSGFIFCFQGGLSGKLGNKKEDGYVFDPYIFISTENGCKSLAQLEKENIKHLYSPRTKSIQLLEKFFENEETIDNLDEFNNISVFTINELEEWKGNYQS